MSFQIHALPAAEFQALFQLPDEELESRNARRLIADSKDGYPCRVSLRDAEIGEEVMLLHYQHQPEQTPYRASHAIFVRNHAEQAFPAENEIPDAIRKRLISVRAFDASHNMTTADVAAGTELEGVINGMFEGARVAYIHLHNARAGCFAARVTRA